METNLLETRLAAVASAIADKTRASMLCALMDGYRAERDGKCCTFYRQQPSGKADGTVANCLRAAGAAPLLPALQQPNSRSA